MSIERTACKTNHNFIWPTPCAFAAEYSHSVSDPFFWQQVLTPLTLQSVEDARMPSHFCFDPGGTALLEKTSASVVQKWSHDMARGFCVSNFWQDEDKRGHSYELNTAGLRVCLLFRIQTSSYQRMFWFMVVSFYLQGLYANHYKKVIQRVE